MENDRKSSRMIVGRKDSWRKYWLGKSKAWPGTFVTCHKDDTYQLSQDQRVIFDLVVLCTRYRYTSCAKPVSFLIFLTNIMLFYNVHENIIPSLHVWEGRKYPNAMRLQIKKD